MPTCNFLDTLMGVLSQDKKSGITMMTDRYGVLAFNA